ncbi:MAG TPA: DUF3761 domain-containing protein [Candidatus Saccharimonadales bacterium]
MRKCLGFAVTAIISFVALTQVSFAASNNVKIGLNNAYLKSDGTYAVVVKDAPNVRLALYVDDVNPVYATANKKDWATFRGVKLANNSKISFGRMFKADSKTYQKPINYVRYATISDTAVAFVASNPIKPTAAVAKPATETVSTPAPTPAPQPVCTNGTYVNSGGNTVCSPEAAPTTPTGATAQCIDGTYSFSQTHSGTCSHHGGVAEWL